MKESTKRQIAVFFASFVITACILAFAASAIVVESNTAATSDSAAACALALETEQHTATLTINDREYAFSLEQINSFLKSRGTAFICTLWFLL